MVNSNKLKVVLICQFVNQEMRDYFNNQDVNELAPWIGLLIDLFKKREDIELNVVALNCFTDKDEFFSKEGINYYLYKRVPFPLNFPYLKKIYTYPQLELYTNFLFIKRKIFKIVKKIKPDILHLYGAEIPHSSTGIIRLFNKFPTFVTIQGFIKGTADDNLMIRKQLKFEKIILTNSKYLGVSNQDMCITAKEFNPDAKLLFHKYPYAQPIVIKDNIGEKESIDCLFFARVCKDKGIEDLLNAIHIVKKQKHDITLSIIGGIDAKYETKLKNICKNLEIEKNVSFLGFFGQQQIYNYALNAKVSVLPTHRDLIPGTIIESMRMKLPVIAYAVGGIPELNDDDENIILVEKFNIQMLADKILLLVNNSNLRKSLAEKAYEYVERKFNHDRIIDDIVYAYKYVLNNGNE